MAIKLANALIDGQMEFSKGVDTYRAPVRVPRNQLCLSVNGTTRQDFLGPRSRWKQVKLSYAGADAATTQFNFEQGLFQGWNEYVPDQGPAHLVFSVSGRLFRVNALTGGGVQTLTYPTGDKGNPTNREQAWFKQAELFLVIQDGQSLPTIYDGATVRRSDVNGKAGVDANGVPLREVPTGTVMEYSGGRLWVALPDGISFVGGDGVYGPTGTVVYGRRDSVLKFTENQYYNGGGAFAVPSNMGPITAMKALANLDTSLGQGPLQVMTPSGCFSVDAPFDRAQWALVQYPIKTVSLLDQGARGQWSTVLVNGDLWYRASDGVRSFLIARRDFGTWGNRAMSYEVIKHLKDDEQTLLGFSSGALFDNRLLVTCQPMRDFYHGVYHKGVVVLDFIPVTSLAGPEQPCWDGLWTGLDILQVRTIESQGVQHCFAAVLGVASADGIRRIELWELQRDGGADEKADGTEVRVSRSMESPQLDFSPSSASRMEMKLLEGADLWIDDLAGVVDFNLYYRPDQYPCWFLWKSWKVCAKDRRCAGDVAGRCVAGGMSLQRQYRARMGAQRPPSDVVGFVGLPSRVGYVFQFRLEIVGDCKVTAVRLLATRLAEASFGSDPASLCTEMVCCVPNDFGPSTVIPSQRVPPELVGIVEEPGEPWIGLEDGGLIIRTEDQPPTPGDGPPGVKYGRCQIGSICTVLSEVDCAAAGGTYGGDDTTCPPTPPVELPVDPVPPLTCGGGAPSLRGPTLAVEDPQTGVTNVVGIAPGALTPEAYLMTYGAPGCLEAWANAVWQQFIASGISYTQARLIWVEEHDTGDNWQATQVFPAQEGGYNGVQDLDTKIVVEYCP